MRRFLLGAALLLSFTVTAQPRLQLTVDSIMRGPALAGYTPRALRWSPDGQLVYFEWKQYGDPIEKKYDTYVVGRDGKGLRKLSDEEAKQATPENADYTRDRKRAVYIDRGDVFLYDGLAKKRRALTATTEAESQARFTRDENRIAFVRGNNLFVLSLADGSVTQMTNIVGSDEKGPNVTLFDEEGKDRTDSQKWVAAEAKKLSDVLSRRVAAKKEEDEKRKNELARAPLKLKKGETVSSLRLTPDERYVVAFLTTEAEGVKETAVPTYVTESGYTSDLTSREKVGDRQATSRVASIATADGKVQWLKSGLKPIEAATEATAEGKTKTATSEEGQSSVQRTEEKAETKDAAERELELDNIFWSDDGTRAVLLVRAIDNKDWWLLALDPATATTRVLFNEHDKAWVQWIDEGFAGFVPKTHTVWFLSEKSGWQQVYTVPYEGGTPVALTSGQYEVDHVQPTPDGKTFFVTTSRESLYEHHFYRLPTTGGALTKLTTAPGWHDAVPSPDGTTFADLYSYTNRPTEVYIGETRVTQSPSPEFATYPWLDVPIVEFTARDGVKVPAHLYKPANWNGGPAVIFVHGAGYTQNVNRAWSYYFREYMFHQLLMERGYLVIDIDYRASAGHGRDWRTAIYRHMGGVDLDDHVDAAKWLVREHNVDPKRIGIYGGSYGGFITLMALFTQPDVFAAGAALRPVTDWAHYNHGYTSNILNTPQKDPEAYRRSSPIYFAEGLKGALLICHGVIDVNVEFQDTVRLVQRLIELRKENWQTAMYPLEDHGFVEATSWADEYKRILGLFERELK
jgi:dipeptidyl aminopeptidase/acylaminoacyl peptidase